MLSKQRIIDLENLIELWEEKLNSFEVELAITASAPVKFEIRQRIKREILPSLHKYENEYWQLLKQFSEEYIADEQAATSAISTVVQGLNDVSSQDLSHEILAKVKEILDKLNEPGTPAARAISFISRP
jgi:hypothetical protein